jgi:hypothetical protein
MDPHHTALLFTLSRRTVSRDTVPFFSLTSPGGAGGTADLDKMTMSSSSGAGTPTATTPTTAMALMDSRGDIQVEILTTPPPSPHHDGNKKDDVAKFSTFITVSFTSSFLKSSTPVISRNGRKNTENNN